MNVAGNLRKTIAAASSALLTGKIVLLRSLPIAASDDHALSTKTLGTGGVGGSRGPYAHTVDVNSDHHSTNVYSIRSSNVLDNTAVSPHASSGICSTNSKCRKPLRIRHEQLRIALHILLSI